MTPTEPAPGAWVLPPATSGDGDLVSIGADLEPQTILAAYRAGIFPMEVRRGVIGWWSPQRRGILPLSGLRVSGSLRRAMRDLEVRVDTAFEEVIRACARTPRPGAWITPEIVDAYVRLHRLGWAHSVETWSRRDGGLAGGLYGVAIGGLFAGESMFHRRRDASKAALAALVELLGGAEGEARGRLLDVQWRTDHLGSLGAVEVTRSEYLRLLERALGAPLPAAFAPAPGDGDGLEAQAPPR